MAKRKRRQRPRRPSASSEYRQRIRQADETMALNRIDVRPDNWQEVALDCFAPHEPERGELARYVAANEKRLGVSWAREIVRLTLFFQVEDHVHIIKHYDLALSRYPRCALVEMWVADQIFRRAADFWRARPMYHYAIRTMPDLPKPYYELGFMNYLLGDYGGALDYFDRAAERATGDDAEMEARIFFNRGIVRYLVDDDKTAAIADLKEALKRNPDYPQARETLRDLQNETRWALW
jgi:tetratricopeptide (TPR) repeat protein